MTQGVRIAFWLVIAAVAGLLFVNGQAIPLTDPDEARFARTSVEMQRSRDLVVPHFEGQPRLVKPPLVHWIQSTLFTWLGVHGWVARLHAALATLGSLLVVGWIARRRFGDEAAVWSAAVLGTMPLVVLVGHLGTLDSLLAVHVLAVIGIDLTKHGDRLQVCPRLHRLHYAVGALLGLAFLAKGPVGVVLPLLIMLAGRTGAGREILPSWRAALRAAGAWCVVVLPWGLAFLRRLGGSEIVGIVKTEALERYFGGTTHVEPFWFYLPVLAVGLLPWVAPLVTGLVRVVALRDRSSRTARYAAAGLVTGLIFFSLGASKLPNYLLPLMPLAAIVVTWELGQELERARRGWGSILLVSVMAVLAAAIGIVGGVRLVDEPQALALTAAGIYGAGALIAGRGLLRRRPRQVYGAAAAASGAFLLATLLILIPAVARTRTAAYLIEAVPELSGGRPVAVVDMKVPSLTFYLDRAPEQVDLSQLAARLTDPDRPLFVFDEADLARTPEAALARLREVGRQGKYVVYEKASR